VRQIGDRLRSNGVWDAGGIEEPRDGVEFAMLGCIAEGHMTRQYDRAAGEWKYSMTPAGIAHVENAMGREL
jgi:hypothetical protein